MDTNLRGEIRGRQCLPFEFKIVLGFGRNGMNCEKQEGEDQQSAQNHDF